MVIDQSYSGQQIELRIGQSADLRLPENPTTGYRWAVVSDGAPSCRLEDGGFATQPGPPGHGGEHSWRLVAIRAGTCELELTPRRSFAPAETGNPTFSLRVTVTG